MVRFAPNALPSPNVSSSMPSANLNAVIWWSLPEMICSSPTTATSSIIDKIKSGIFNMNNNYLALARQKISDPQILSVVAAKRAKQLAMGGRPMIKCDSENLLDIALLEIAEGLLTYEFGDEVPEEAAAEEAAVEAENPAE
ncbi:MAG: DNA-directed RNA polymerase subunit omega [Lentisphaerae bacterium]|nr:DNA-directed RNA polymerase subunit omega [Lentisphaerota bacterium]